MPAGTRVVEPLDSWEQGIPYRIADGLAADWLERRPITTMSDDPTARELRGHSKGYKPDWGNRSAASWPGRSHVARPRINPPSP
jgi:hypothetical protein